MAYLTEQFLRQGMRQKASHIQKIESGNEHHAEQHNAHPITNEQKNFQIAQKISETKYQLVELLAQFPVTGFLLISHYQNKLPGTQEDATVLVSDLSAVLEKIKIKFNQCADLFAPFNPQNQEYLTAKQELTESLKFFPYLFNDLTFVVDVLAHVHPFRNLSLEANGPLDKKTQELISKRVKGKKRHCQKIAQLDDWLIDTAGHIFGRSYEKEFLFLSLSEMEGLFSALVLAEHRWLTARQQLAQANHKLVLFIANQYKSGFLDFDDLVQEGQAGLLKAVDRFEYQLGFQFSTYAGYWIRQAISRALSRSERLIRIPCGQVSNINKLFRAKNELTVRTGAEPSTKELANYTKLPLDEVEDILSFSQSVMSLEGSDDEEEGFAPIDFLEQSVFTPAFTTLAERDLGHLLDNAVASLNSREAQIVCSHFGFKTDQELTLQEIGADLNLTRERVRQIQVIALNKMKQNFGDELACFL